jgi:hypothetical protein
VEFNERGHLLPGSVLNPGGRPRGAIQEVRELLGPHAPKFVDELLRLLRSDNEAIRLAAIREAFDRLLGKPAVAVDTTVAKFDIGAMYIRAMQSANRSRGDEIDVAPAHEPADAW